MEGQFLFPGKFLNGKAWLKVVNGLEKTAHLIFLLGDAHFSREILTSLCEDFSSEIWIVVHRGHEVQKTLKKIPEHLHEKCRFYCPPYQPKTDQFLTGQELNKLVALVNTQFPQIKVAPPEHLDLFNPSIDPFDFEMKIETVFEHEMEGEIAVSVIIPTFNNKDYVLRVVKQLLNQKVKEQRYQIIVVDDGSTDGTAEHLKAFFESENLVVAVQVLFYPRNTIRKMGDSSFRAGLARTAGVSRAKGKVYAFLDSDIIVPSNYIQDLIENHKRFDVVQVTRIYLKEEASRKLSGFSIIDKDKDAFHPEDGYWKNFFDDTRAWPEMPSYWKYTCTYGLSVSAEHFVKVGGFRSIFNSYGFEDTDLGYRLSKAGARFYKSPMEVYHLWHTPYRSEFNNSDYSRFLLLKRSAGIFFRHCLDPAVFQELKTFLSESRPIFRRYRGSKLKLSRDLLNSH